MNERKLNNKGFSLVELIIVIAIMAILVGVLAPQYIKYVEKSRTSTDIQTLGTIHDALLTVSVDPSYTVDKDITITLTKGADLDISYDGTDAANIEAALIEILGSQDQVKGKSKAGDGAQVVYDSANDTVYYKSMINGSTLSNAYNDISQLQSVYDGTVTP